MTTNWNANPYYSPQECGLELIADINFTDNYDFDMIAVWRNEDGELFWACDAGCSCPCPFENYTSLDSLDRLSNWEYFEKTVTGRPNYTRADVGALLREVDAAYCGR